MGCAWSLRQVWATCLEELIPFIFTAPWSRAIIWDFFFSTQEDTEAHSG